MATPRLPSTTSIMDYLASRGEDNSYTNRSKLYRSSGLEKRLGSYKGAANQNLALLDYVKNQAKYMVDGGPATPGVPTAFETAKGFAPWQPPMNAVEADYRAQGGMGNLPYQSQTPTSTTPNIWQGRPMNAFEAAAALGFGGTTIPVTGNTPIQRVPIQNNYSPNFTPRSVRNPYTPTTPGQMPSGQFSPQSGSAFTPRSVTNPSSAPTPTRYMDINTPTNARGASPVRTTGAQGAGMTAARFLSANPATAGAIGFGLPFAQEAYADVTGKTNFERTYEGSDTATANSSPQYRTEVPGEQLEQSRGVGEKRDLTPVDPGIAMNPNQRLPKSLPAEKVASMFPSYVSPLAKYGFDAQGEATTAPTPEGAAPTGGATATAPQVDTSAVNDINTPMGRFNEEIAQAKRQGTYTPEFVAGKIEELQAQLDTIEDAASKEQLIGAMNQATAENTGGVSADTMTNGNANAAETGLIDSWLNSAEGQLALEEVQNKNLDAQSANEVAKEAFEQKYEQEKTELEQNLAANGLAFSGMRASQVKALADALAASNLGADRTLASKLLDADLQFRKTVLKGVADLLDQASKDEENAIKQLNLAGWAVLQTPEGQKLVPTTAARNAEIDDIRADAYYNLAVERLNLAYDENQRAWAKFAESQNGGSTGNQIDIFRQAIVDDFNQAEEEGRAPKNTKDWKLWAEANMDELDNDVINTILAEVPYEPAEAADIANKTANVALNGFNQGWVWQEADFKKAKEEIIKRVDDQPSSQMTDTQKEQVKMFVNSYTNDEIKALWAEAQ